MDGLIILQICLAVIGVGTPVSTLIYNVGKQKEWSKHVDEAFQTIFDNEEKCLLKRESTECDIYNKIDHISEGINFLRGKFNGVRS